MIDKKRSLQQALLPVLPTPRIHAICQPVIIYRNKGGGGDNYSDIIFNEYMQKTISFNPSIVLLDQMKIIPQFSSTISMPKYMQKLLKQE